MFKQELIVVVLNLEKSELPKTHTESSIWKLRKKLVILAEVGKLLTQVHGNI